jgi:hypothetical protein
MKGVMAGISPKEKKMSQRKVNFMHSKASKSLLEVHKDFLLV